AAELDELRRREQQSGAARRLDLELRGLDEQLFQAGEGTAVDTLEADFGALQADTLDVERQELQQAIEEAEHERERLHQTFGSLQKGLDEFDGPSAAA